MIRISPSFSASLLVFHVQHRSYAWLSGLVLVLLLGTGSHAGDPNTGSPPSKPIQADLGKLPLIFIENGGQWDEPIRYALPGQSTRLYFGDRRITVVLQEPPDRERREASLKSLPPRPPQKRWVVQIGLVGARKNLRPEGVERALGKVSYFKGNNEQWRTGLSTYHTICYREVWPGIDLEYRGVGPTLKSTFVVKPGSDPKQIRLAYQGAERVGVMDAGVLAVSTPVGGFREDAPDVYQEARGQRKAVVARYQIRKTGLRQREVRFALGRYDRRQPLIIDPVVTLGYAGYIGGSSFDVGDSIAVDGVGNAYVLGSTQSDQTTFPEVGGPDLTYNGVRDAFVAKVLRDGTGLAYAGYIGGSGSDAGLGIAVDGVGNAYVTGWTASDQVTFPETRGPDLIYNGGVQDSFVAKVVGPPVFGIGVFRPGSQQWLLDTNRNGKWNGCVLDDCQGPFGLSTDLAVVGDWNSSGLSKIGVYRPSTRQFFLDRNGDGLFTNCTVDRCTGAFGLSGDRPVVGNWLGGTNPTRVGVFRPSTQRWTLDKNGNGLVDGCTVDLCLGPFGESTDIPVAGDWTGDGKAKIGVFRPRTGQFLLDRACRRNGAKK